MACEYREADRSKLEATSSYAGAIADEIIIIDRVGEYSGSCFEHLIEIFDLPRGKLFEYAFRNLKSDIRIGFTGTTGQLAMLEIGRLSGGVGGASALLLSSVWESAAKLLGTEKIAFFALSNCELMALVAEERIIHALKSGLFDAARESVPVEEYFPKSIYGIVSDKSGYCLHRF